MASSASAPSTYTLTINVFDGTRNLLKPGVDVPCRICEGTQRALAPRELQNSSVRFTDLKFFNKFADNYRVVVSAAGEN